MDQVSRGLDSVVEIGRSGEEALELPVPKAWVAQGGPHINRHDLQRIEWSARIGVRGVVSRGSDGEATGTEIMESDIVAGRSRSAAGSGVGFNECAREIHVGGVLDVF